MKLLLDLQKDIIKANSSAINKAARTALSRTETFIMETYSIKKKDLNEVVKLIKANMNRNYASVLIKEKGIGLYKFSPRQTQKGVTAAVKKGERKLYTSKDTKRKSFIATMKSGHQGVYFRKGKERLPIVELFGPSAMQLFTSDKALEKLQEIFIERFKIEFNRELNYRLK
jgi:hypothetical protein